MSVSQVLALNEIGVTSCSILLVGRAIKVKLSPCFNWAPSHEGVLGQWMALDGGDYSLRKSIKFDSAFM